MNPLSFPPCPGSSGGHPHGHVYYVDRKTKERICHYCDRPVSQTGSKDHG